jgi:hypothetical protein
MLYQEPLISSAAAWPTAEVASAWPAAEVAPAPETSAVSILASTHSSTAGLVAPLRYTVTLKGALAISVKPGPANKSFEVIDVKAGGAADAWNKLVKAKRAPVYQNRSPELICPGDLLVQLAGVDVSALDYDIVKSLLQKNSKMPDWDFDLTFVRS